MYASSRVQEEVYCVALQFALETDTVNEPKS